MKPTAKKPTRRERALTKAGMSKVLAFKLKRAQCEDAGIYFPWATAAELAYDVAQAVSIAKSDAIMAEIIASEAGRLYYSQALVTALQQEVREVHSFAASQPDLSDADVEVAEESMVMMPSWSGVSVAERP